MLNIGRCQFLEEVQCLKMQSFCDFAPFDIKIHVVKVYQHRVWRIFLVCVFEAIEEFEARIEGLQGRQS